MPKPRKTTVKKVDVALFTNATCKEVQRAIAIVMPMIIRQIESNQSTEAITAKVSRKVTVTDEGDR